MLTLQELSVLGMLVEFKHRSQGYCRRADPVIRSLANKHIIKQGEKEMINISFLRYRWSVLPGQWHYKSINNYFDNASHSEIRAKMIWLDNYCNRPNGSGFLPNDVTAHSFAPLYKKARELGLLKNGVIQ